MDAPKIIVGPPTSSVSREDAEKKLLTHPSFPKNASYSLDSVEGRWIAAFTPKQASPPDAFLDGGGSGDTPDGPPAPNEEPKGPPSDDEPSDEAPSEDGPPKDDKDGDEGGKSLEDQVSHLTELLTTVVDALGLGGHHDDSPIPGHDEGPPSGPEGLDGPPGPPPGASADGKSHTVHERALKPGEAPPGTTPVGAPSFASTNPDHPWKDLVGVKRTFQVESPISAEDKLASVVASVKAVAEGTGYRVEQVNETTDSSGQRVARALITKS